VLLDLRRADQDRSADLLRDGTAMAAVTADGRPVQGCRSVPLGAMRYLAVASPRFCSRWFPAGVDAAALEAAPQVAFDLHDALQRRFAARLGAREPAPTHRVPAQQAFAAAVGAGLGWGMVPEAAVRDQVLTGVLVDLSPGAVLDVPLFWQHWKVGAPALTHLTSRVLEAASQALEPSF
jgi:LysR family transcriptional regulator (chromosome initiation inhibitor)